MLPGFHALSMAWLFALLAPLVAFYFLKLKRPRQDVSSLALWQQVINDQRVNSPFQKFKRNLLLLLQILLLTLLVLAAMQPFLQARPDRLKRLPILIDCSASMAALDKPGGQSRLDAAKEKVRKLIDGMSPDQEYCLVAFARTARKVVGFTNNKRVLLDGLDEIAVEDVTSEIEDALRMAQALARTARGGGAWRGGWFTFWWTDRPRPTDLQRSRCGGEKNRSGRSIFRCSREARSG
jgi:Ca-activated chloride channel family protein